MVNQVAWSLKAISTFENIIDYLETEWTEKEVTNFVARVYDKLELISRHPAIGIKQRKKKNIFRTILHKRITLVYQYKPMKKEILLVTFWNNWQDPKRLKY